MGASLGEFEGVLIGEISSCEGRGGVFGGSSDLDGLGEGTLGVANGAGVAETGVLADREDGTGVDGAPGAGLPKPGPVGVLTLLGLLGVLSTAGLRIYGGLRVGMAG